MEVRANEAFDVYRELYVFCYFPFPGVEGVRWWNMDKSTSKSKIKS